MNHPLPHPTPQQIALLKRFDELGICHKTTCHAPVFTVEESRDLRGQIPGLHCKSLFLKAKTKQLYLAVVLEDRRVDLNTLAKHLNAKRFSFGSAELLQEILDVSPGSVTPYALIHDTDLQIIPLLDRELMSGEPVNFHPLKNDATTTISGSDLLLFIESCGHKPQIIDFSALTSA